MDDPLHQFEAELQALRPRRVAPGLLRRLEAELSAPAARPTRYVATTTWTSWKWIGWRVAAVAASLAVTATLVVTKLGQRPDVPPSLPPSLAQQDVPVTSTAPERATVLAASPGRYRPVSAANVLYDMKDEGVVYAANDAPARRLRYRYLDTYTWKNPKTNSSLKWSIPRDEVRVVPVNLN